MALCCGIVGLPNVGKSTLFNAITNNQAQASNYPFCTIDPNIGIAAINDQRLAQLAALVCSEQTIYATIEFVDIAGLVRGASDNAGLGNRFLSHIRETDGIIHVVRCFEDDEITHVEGVVNPVSDIETINLELILADYATVERTKTRMGKQARDKDTVALLKVCEKLLPHLSNALPVRSLALTSEEQKHLEPLCLLSSKPTIYVANLKESDNGEHNSSHLSAVEAFAAKEGAQVVPVYGQIEADIADFEESEKKEFLQPLNINQTALDRISKAAFDLLDLMTYFTVGKKEARAWTLKKGSNAKQAAAVIHNDFARGFICAEVIKTEDYLACGSENSARELGKARLEGRDYTVLDGDIIHFRFNV